MKYSAEVCCCLLFFITVMYDLPQAVVPYSTEGLLLFRRCRVHREEEQQPYLSTYPSSSCTPGLGFHTLLICSQSRW